MTNEFFTTNGKDIWKVEAVETVTEVRLKNCETQEVETCRIKEGTMERFFAVEMPKIKRCFD